MDKPNPVLITIQKFVCLLSDEHYNEFAGHLLKINATLPLKLAQTIRVKLPEFDTHEALCKEIYGSFEKGPKLNFNQLASYTLRLSDVLVQNYPNYLHHNINRIQQLVNDGRGEEANFLADILLDIAERIDDFQCSIFVLNFLSQQAFIIKDVATGVKLDARLLKVAEQEHNLTEIELLTRETLRNEKTLKHELDKIKDYLIGFTNDASAAIRIVARYSLLLILKQFDLRAFETPETNNLIGQLKKDLNNHSHIVLPYLCDIRGSLVTMKEKAGVLANS